MLLVTPLREVDVLERERLLVERGWLSLPGPFPGAGVAEVRVVASGLALRGLALDAEVAAAGLTPVERIEAHQLRELEEVRDAAGLLERLVQLLTGPEHAHVPVELLAQLRDLRERPPETRVGPGHAAVVPHESAELPVEGVDGPPAVDLEERMRAPADVLLCFAERGVRGIELLRLRRGHIVRHGRGEDEIAVRQSLHEGARAQAVRTLIGEVGLAGDEEPGNGGHQMIVDPEPAHRVVRRRIDPHGHAISVVARDALVDLEEVAVLLPDVVEAEPRDGVGEVEIHAVAAGPDAATLVADLLGGARGDVARHEVAEARVASFEVVVALALRDVARAPRVALLLRDPDASVV